PIVGLRDRRPTAHALVGADVVTQPGSLIRNATILIEGGAILAVSKDLNVPAGFQVIDCQGKRVYAGLIDAFSELNVPLADEQPGYWNSNVMPQRNVSVAAAKNPIDQAAKLRSQGITSRLVAPQGGIIKGTSCVVQLGSDPGQRLLSAKSWHHLQLTVPRTGSRPRYPNSPMGATALLRQSLYDAQWYSRAWTAYRSQPTLPRPKSNRALQVLVDAIDVDTFVIDAQNERMAIRAGKVADEFSLKWILRGSGREYRQLAEIAAMNRAVLVPVNFPEAPKVQSAEAARSTS
ncbi:MAG: N-acetylglucosamine-6-phosphate deacetylase, partial [Planctomycetaceae bacterium]|nr:N-acetylglucosamine-6-phosphate deacetylase [Planctomycetaceae bacterium]